MISPFYFIPIPLLHFVHLLASLFFSSSSFASKISYFSPFVFLLFSFRSSAKNFYISLLSSFSSILSSPYSLLQSFLYSSLLFPTLSFPSLLYSTPLFHFHHLTPPIIYSSFSLTSFIYLIYFIPILLLLNFHILPSSSLLHFSSSSSILSYASLPPYRYRLSLYNLSKVQLCPSLSLSTLLVCSLTPSLSLSPNSH